MRFLVDAQLPKRFCVWLETAGHDAIHTIDLPDGNGTTDKQVIKVAEREQRVVITKDDDFVQSYLINGQPSRLLLVATGNISNEALEVLLKTQVTVIVDAFEAARFIELGRDALAVHE